MSMFAHRSTSMRYSRKEVVLCLLFSIITLILGKSTNATRSLPCQVKNHCRAELGVHSDCVNRICICTNESQPQEIGGNKTCHKLQYEIGVPCESEEECTVDSSHCTKYVCRCKDGLVPSNNRSRCLPVVDALNGDCEESSQCNQVKLGEQATCLQGKCDCTADAVKIDGMCFKLSGLNENCTDTRNCQHTNNSDCEKNVCTCVKNFVPSFKNTSTCLPVATTRGEKCELNNQCSEILGDSFTCLEGECNCMHKFVYDENSTKCVESEATTVTQTAITAGIEIAKKGVVDAETPPVAKGKEVDIHPVKPAANTNTAHQTVENPIICIISHLVLLFVLHMSS